MEHSIHNLRSELERLQNECEAIGAKAQAAEFGGLIAALDEHDSKSISEYVSTTRQLLAQKRKRPSPKNKPINELAVERYVKLFEDCGTDQAQFDQVFDELKKDKKHIRKNELLMITTRYYGQVKKTLTVGQLQDKIKSRFIELGQNESKKSFIDKLTPW